MKQTRAEVDRVVAALNEKRQAEFFRNPDRPDASIMRPRRKAQSPEVIKAKSRIRVAAWRNEQDRKRAPTTQQVGAALVVALASTAKLDELTHDDPGLIGKALVILRDNGFDIVEALATLKRVQARLRSDGHVHVESQAAGPGQR